MHFIAALFLAFVMRHASKGSRQVQVKMYLVIHELKKRQNACEFTSLS
jgi:hypothetical protein